MKTKPIRDYIEGIFNYCDRWCERCAFTTRCMNFALEEELERQDKACDEDTRRFWEEIDRSCEEMIAKAEVLDASYNPAPTGFGDDFEYQFERDSAKSHPCAERAFGYIALADAWFKASGLEAGHSPLPSSALDDNLQVVRWYQMFIYVKLMRAVSGLQRHPEQGLDPQSSPSGSVKIALIAIDRSIGAWGFLLKQIAGTARETNRIIAYLAGLRRLVEETFPAARAFIRPGFDRVGKGD
jgi:hypothetical protein